MATSPQPIPDLWEVQGLWDMAQVSFTGYSYRLTDQNIIVFDTTVLTFKAIGDNLEFSYSIASDEGLFSPIDFDPESFDQAYVFTFNGDPLPDLLDPEIAVAWCASIFDYRLIDEGILAIDSTVQFATLEHAEIQYGDTITGTRDGDTLGGGGGTDLLKGLGGPDFLFGRGDDDKLLGNGGTDQFYGGSGNDVLRGGRGGDWLTGGARNDQLWGGPGADYFLFDAELDNGVDRINDFDPGSDRIVIEHLDGFGDITFRQVDRGLRLEFHDTAIILAGLDSSQISADDILFL